MSTQKLLIPVTFNADRLEVATVEEHAGVLHQLGFDMAPLSPTALAVRAVPAMLASADGRRTRACIAARSARVRRQPRAHRASA